MSYQSMEEVYERCEKDGISFWKAIQLGDAAERGVTEEDSWERMKGMWQAMQDSLDAYDPELMSRSRLVGKEGGQMDHYLEQNAPLCGTYMAKVMANALKMGCNNACMKRIVAAPTAGACGVVPAVFLSMQEKYHYTDEEMTKALYVASGIGGVIASRAFIAGAQGGCQAEIGSASAMAAGGAVHLRGGSAEAVAHAAAMALKNLLGLVCDPVAGLVEVPCVKRNVSGAVVALSAADMALAGVRSRIPPDEVIDAMREVGISMPACLRETGEGGLAATPEGIKMRDRIMD